MEIPQCLTLEEMCGYSFVSADALTLASVARVAPPRKVPAGAHATQQRWPTWRYPSPVRRATAHERLMPRQWQFRSVGGSPSRRRSPPPQFVKGP